MEWGFFMSKVIYHFRNQLLIYISFGIFVAVIYLGSNLWFIVPIFIVYSLYMYLERKRVVNYTLKRSYVFAGLLLYFSLIYMVTNITRMIFIFETQKDLIAFIDVLTFGLLAYLPVFVLSESRNVILRKQRLILYIIVFVYIALPIFNIFDISKSDLDYFWTILVLDNIFNLLFNRNH